MSPPRSFHPMSGVEKETCRECREGFFIFFSSDICQTGVSNTYDKILPNAWGLGKQRTLPAYNAALYHCYLTMVASTYSDICLKS